MKLTGHKTEAIYRRYAIVAEQDLREGVAKLAALHSANPKGEAADRAADHPRGQSMTRRARCVPEPFGNTSVQGEGGTAPMRLHRCMVTSCPQCFPMVR
jgi:hypothetical protein